MVSLRKGLKGYRTLVLAVAGAALVIFGVLWITVIFPALNKVPSNYEQSYYFEGEFSQMNPATMGFDRFPIEQTLTQEAVGSEGGALLIHEVRSVVNAATGEDISAVYGDESTLAINPATLEFMPAVDERGRTGYWGPPKMLGEGDSFNLWNPGARQPLAANYVRSESFQGLDVVVFETNQVGIPIGTDPQSGMSLFLSPMITLWVEPTSGTVVNQTSTTTTSASVMGAMMPVQISKVDYTEATVAGLMDTARSAKWMLLWFQTLIPWIAIGFGGLVTASAASLAVAREVRKSRSRRRGEVPGSTSLPLDVQRSHR